MALLRNILRWGLPKRRRSFARDERGATAVEFGILAVPFFFILFAILETGIVMLSGQILESAVQDASRQIRTGQAQKSSMTIANYRAQICDRLYGLFGDCSGLFIDVSPITNFASATVTPPIDTTCKSSCNWTRGQSFTPSAGGIYVLVQVYYKWPVVLTWGDITSANLAEGKRLLSAVAVFRNEPFT